MAEIHFFQNSRFFGDSSNANELLIVLPEEVGCVLPFPKHLIPRWSDKINNPPEETQVNLKYTMSYERSEKGNIKLDTVKRTFTLLIGVEAFDIGTFESIKEYDQETYDFCIFVMEIENTRKNNL